MHYAPSFNQQSQDYRLPIIISVVLHAAAIMALGFNFDFFSADEGISHAKVIDAVVVDSSVLDAIDEKKRKKEQLKKQQQLQAEQKRQQEAERIRKEKLEQQRLAEQQRLEEKKKIEEQKRIEEKKLEEQKRLQDQQRREEERRQLEQEQRAEWERLQAEEQAAAEQARGRELANSMSLYKQAIKQRVDRNWVRPLSAENGYSCEVIVDQIPGGEIINVEIGRCDGDIVFQRSVRNAVYNSSPLPNPQNPALFDRRINFTFEVPSE